MPIGSGARGRPGILAAPGISRTGSTLPRGAVRRFRSRPNSSVNGYISGITKDSTGAALGAVTVDLLRSPDDAFVGTTVSDGAGNYSLPAPGSGPFRIVAYKTGSPDVAGTTVNTLLPTVFL